ncbi:hypothetical protein HPB47_012335 [Ixodes persulcatus]|uniref:Uncharacterized protein n=1 Tax=Ixodes persulcatus TaxID=34615 RepID=A0AC60NTV6_IXOPE|nr:hypothetical protein HPB47_012335 [Ixodes persulcatus]
MEFCAPPPHIRIRLEVRLGDACDSREARRGAWCRRRDALGAGDRHAGACALSRGYDNSLNFDATDTSPHGSPPERYTALSTQQTTMDTNAFSSQPNEDEGWQSVTRRRARRVKPEQLRLERVSRPDFSFAIRPLHKVSIHAIPKQALTGAIEGAAPNRGLADMATYRLDTRDNTIRVTVRDEEHARNLTARKRLVVEISKQIKTFEVEIERAPTNKPTVGRGVIKVRPDHTLDYIKDHIRCETATILDLKLLEKSEMLLITFDTPEIPTRLAFGYEIVRVYPYRQNLIACYNGHQLGHVAKFCPAETVCRDCGQRHPPPTAATRNSFASRAKNPDTFR